MSNDQMEWLMSTIGLGDAPVKKFSVEYIVKGGGYSFTTLSASTIPEVLDMTLDHNTHDEDIAVVCIEPVEKGVQKQFHLLNYTRI